MVRFLLGILAYNPSMQLSWTWNAVLSALFAGATAVIAKMGLAGINADLATLVRTAFVLLFLLAVYFALHGAPNVGQLSAKLLAVLAGLLSAVGEGNA